MTGGHLKSPDLLLVLLTKLSQHLLSLLTDARSVFVGLGHDVVCLPS